MSKGSGTTRSGGSSNPRGLSESERSIIGATERAFSAPVLAGTPERAETPRILREIDRIGFKSEIPGQWDLTTPYGGAMILDETDFRGEMFGFKEYGVSAWDADDNMIEDGQERNAKRFNSLNEAKRYARQLLKSKYQ